MVAYTSRETGYCPEAGRTISIAVEIVRIPWAGGIGIVEQDNGYSCKYANENGCKTRGHDGRTCPLYIAAKRKLQ